MAIETSLLPLAVSWWEPGTEGALDVGDLSVMLTFVITLVGTMFGVMRWWARKLRGMVREEIEVATEPIHPNSNGGLSLADVARRTERLEEGLDRVREGQQEVKDLLLRALAHAIGDWHREPERDGGRREPDDRR